MWNKICNTHLITPGWTRDLWYRGLSLNLIILHKSYLTDTITCLRVWLAWNVPSALASDSGHVELTPRLAVSLSWAPLLCIFAETKTPGKVAQWSSSGNFINGAGRLRHATRALIMRKTYDVAINLFVLLVCAVQSRVDLGLSLTLRWEPWAGNIAECCNSTEWSAHVSPHHEEKAIGRELGRGGQETGDCTEGQKPGKCRIRAWPHIDHVTASLWIWCRHRYSIYQRRYSQVGHPEKGESTWSNWLLLGKRPAWSSSMDGSGKS